MLRESSQTQETILGFHLHEMPRKDEFIENKSRLLVAGNWGQEWELAVKSHVGTYWREENALEMICGGGYTTQ